MDSFSGLSDSGYCYMIDPRGSVHNIKSWEIDNLKQQGWRIIVNPKKRYYEEYDLENKNNSQDSIDESSENFLEGDWI